MEPDYAINLYVKEKDSFAVTHYFKEVVGISHARVEVVQGYWRPDNRFLTAEEIAAITLDHGDWLLSEAHLHWLDHSSATNPG
jgi:hypothetical protein